MGEFIIFNIGDIVEYLPFGRKGTVSKKTARIIGITDKFITLDLGSYKDTVSLVDLRNKIVTMKVVKKSGGSGK